MNKVLLLSIRPIYSEKIFSGEKQVELRRTRPSVREGDLVLVYTSSPSCELTGAFVVGSVEAGTPKTLWEKVRPECGITKAQYDDYFQGAEKAYGIRIERAWRLDAPVKLAKLRRRSVGFHPPQSYRYFDSGDLKTLMPTLTAHSLLSASRGQRK
jgi:predicted transcriptional regulator